MQDYLGLEIISGLSCVGSLAVIVSYLYFAHFRRHPSVIVLFLCVSLSLFVIHTCTIHHCETSLPYTRHSIIVCKAGSNNVTHIKLRLITHHTTLFFISLKAPRHVISYTTLTCFLLVYLCILLRSLTWSVEYVSLKQYGLTFGVWYVSLLTLSIVPPTLLSHYVNHLKGYS